MTTLTKVFATACVGTAPHKLDLFCISTALP